jgi:23S rRNA (cytidine2498-2'-O)-methyltransferase
MILSTNSTKEIIFSTSPEFSQVALNEIQKIDSASKLVQWIEEGVGFVSLKRETFSSFSFYALDSKTVFIRHLFPVLNQLQLEHSEADFLKFRAAIESHFPMLDRAEPTSVQIRLTKEFHASYSRSELWRSLTDFLTHAGFQIEVKHPTQIISIFCTSDVAYLGVSETVQNLSSWAGGIHRFAQESEQISRAEFKLLEAIEVFNLSLPKVGHALDLGASPGGWTRILRKVGLSVTAVDPGDLHESLRNDPHIIHHRQLVQKFLPTCREQFDVIVNDMRMNAIESAKIMVSASNLLTENGLVIMTLKLPNKGISQTIRTAIDILEPQYDLLGARNLFHNRQEATLALRRKSEIR